MTKKTAEKLKTYLGDRYEPSDDELIALYCETHEFYKKMQRELEENDLLVKHTNKYGAENLVKNPLAIELTKTVKVLNDLLKSLGLTAAQRKRVANVEDSDEFEEF